MHDATRNRNRHYADATDESATGGFAVWIVLYAVLMMGAMTFFAGADFLGDRFARVAPFAWNEPI